MLEYTSGRENMEISAIKPNTKYANKFFVNQRPDNEFEGHKIEFIFTTFANMGFIKSLFSFSKLQHCVFIDCYFKKSSFEMTDFTGSKFINCTFDDVTIIDCNFNHTKFKGTSIKYKYIKHSLPKNAFNLCRDLCRNLALESLREGEPEEYKLYYFAEKQASESHCWEKVRKVLPWYKKHYSDWDRLTGIIELISSKFSKYLWGYGEKISFLIRNVLLIILLFSLLYWKLGPVYVLPGGNYPTSIGFLDSLNLSIFNLFTISSVYSSTNTVYRWLSGLQGAFGLILIGFFSAAIFRNINRR